MTATSEGIVTIVGSSRPTDISRDAEFELLRGALETAANHKSGRLYVDCYQLNDHHCLADVTWFARLVPTPL